MFFFNTTMANHLLKLGFVQCVHPFILAQDNKSKKKVCVVGEQWGRI